MPKGRRSGGTDHKATAFEGAYEAHPSTLLMQQMVRALRMVDPTLSRATPPRMVPTTPVATVTAPNLRLDGMIVTAAACRLDTLIEISYACGHQLGAATAAVHGRPTL
ncbi:MAG: hypothetical protein FRX49_06132 [Trebouxia sp. A1-2]|nr:MAG: hypothetical protein FRX49_06132 [Trebouxia sp. A1-2]